MAGLDCMERIPEPSLMEDMEQARAYSEADFEAPHSMFVKLFVQRFGNAVNGYVLDAGCGPADISVRFARQYPECRVVGVDASEAMLACGIERVQRQGLAHRIELVKGYLPGAALPRQQFDAVIVNSLLHHLPAPELMWKILRMYARPGAPVFVMDLIRPGSVQEAADIVEGYSGEEPPVLKQDFYNSLLAAYRPDEVEKQLGSSGLDYLKVEVVSDRHFLVWGYMEE